MSTALNRSGGRLEAVRIPTDTCVHPWDDPVGALPVLEHTLAEAQDKALAEAGAVLVDRPSAGARVVVFTDRQWFTGAALKKLLAGPPGRLRVDDPAFWQTNGSLQDVPQQGVMELGWTTGAAELAGLEPLTVDLDLEDHGAHTSHPRLAHAHRPLRVGAACVHLVQHWTHLMRVNQLAIQAEAYAARDRFADAPMWQKVVQGARMVWKAGGWSESALAAALVETGPDCVIHPTAVVEASRIGAGVHIGPHAVVRGSVLQDNVVVDAHATVVSTVMAAGSRIGPYGNLRFSTLFPGARVSAGPGYQMCVFGRDSFLAWGVAALDLSFGRAIRTETAPGQRVDTGHHFLGCAVGHRAVVGQGVRLAPGAVVPPDATLIAPTHHLFRKWGDHPSTEAPVVPGPDGVRLARSADPAGGGLHGFGRGGEDALLGDDAGDETRGRDVEGEVPGG